MTPQRLVQLKYLFVLLLVVTLLVWAIQTYQAALTPPEVALTVDKAHVFESMEPIPAPAYQESGREVVLPHNWNGSASPVTQIWYSTRLQLNVSPNRLWGIYLPHVKMNAAVYLNGRLLGHGGSFSEPMARNWNRPLYYSIPKGLLRPGENLIQIRVKAGAPNNGYLGPVYLGAEQFLYPAYERNYFVRIAAVQVITVSLLAIGIFMAVLWMLRRQDSVYGWFAAMVLVWATHNLNLFVIDIPVSTHVWEWLWYVTLGWFVVCVVCFVHRFLDARYTRIERVLIVITALGTIVLLYLDDARLHYAGRQIWDSFFLVVALYPALLILRAFHRQHNLELGLVLLTGVVILGFSLRDWLIVNGLRPPWESYLVPYAAPLLFLVLVVILTRRFIHALDEAETLNRELEQRVEKKGQQLQENYQRLQAMEQQRALAAERERIMRDIHDGMGGHLVSTLAMLEDKSVTTTEVAEGLQSALDDLRIMVDSLDPSADDLPTVLAMLRDRMGRAIKAKGIKVNWAVSDLPELLNLGPHLVLQVLRILQEALTNILKHAHAGTLSVRTNVVGDTTAGEMVSITISDDGVGFSNSNSGGRGLDNMRHRAASIGANLNIDTGPEGTTVQLSLPVMGSKGAIA